jgi:hypothetical protein
MKKYFTVTGYFLIIILLLSVTDYTYSQESSYSEDTVSVLFIGDIMGHDEQIRAAENQTNHIFDYEDVFRFIKPVITSADIAIANLEVTLAGPPYKGYPRFSSPASLATACRKSGIDYLVTANNHSADRDNNGIISTINRLDSIGILHTGTFLNRACRDSLSPLTIEKKGISLALLNYTFSTNGIKVPGPAIVNMIDKDQVVGDIQKARQKAADIVILFLHWGKEYDTIPSPAQVDLAKYFLSAGADIIIGSHPHVLQKMVLARDSADGKDNIVIYSLGNFITNQRKPGTDGGAIVKINLSRQKGRVRIIDAGYYLTWVYTPIKDNRKKFFVLPCSEYENKPSFFIKMTDFKNMNLYISKTRNFLKTQNHDVHEIVFRDSSWVSGN